MDKITPKIYVGNPRTKNEYPIIIINEKDFKNKKFGSYYYETISYPNLERVWRKGEFTPINSLKIMRLSTKEEKRKILKSFALWKMKVKTKGLKFKGDKNVKRNPR